MSLLTAGRKWLEHSQSLQIYSTQWSRLLSTGSALLEPAEPKAVPIAKLKDSFNDGTSISYLEELEEKYNKDPNSVDKSWASFFRNLGMLT